MILIGGATSDVGLTTLTISGTGGGKRGRISTAMMVRARPVQAQIKVPIGTLRSKRRGSTSKLVAGAARPAKEIAMRMEPVQSFFADGVRVRLWRVHGNRIRTSAAVYFSGSPSAATDLQSINSKYCASNGADDVSPNGRQAPFRGNLRPIGQDLRLDHRF